MSYGTLSWALLAFLCASDTVAQGVGNQSMRVINPKPQRETLILNYEIGTSSPVHHPVFPCYQEPIPEDAERYPFPIINGRVQIQTAGLRYDGPLLTEHSVNGDWIASFYRGGFQGLSVGSPDVFTMQEADFLIDVKEFEAGTFCGPPMPALTQVNEEPYLDPETSAETTENGITRYNVTEEDLDGVNATIAIEFVHFSPDGQRDEYLLTQVSWKLCRHGCQQELTSLFSVFTFSLPLSHWIIIHVSQCPETLQAMNQIYRKTSTIILPPR